MEVLTQELWTLESGKEVQVKSLETQVQNLSERLQGYEKLEKELDEIVVQSAESEWRQGRG